MDILPYIGATIMGAVMIYIGIEVIFDLLGDKKDKK